ncbi:hypothetical protein E2C01_095744 [Portunus trituberculatus]|uniref:Uncharacterized protein n=1 Tax=Portunus trituberculatus TaxID=210409 RepID=A0A5B7JQM1_PORTR|nr:hypothetical protein [Portunus trituberculatus]
MVQLPAVMPSLMPSTVSSTFTTASIGFTSRRIALSQT